MSRLGVAYHPAVPLHHQIHRVLRSKLESGEWGAEEQVPTEMALARHFSVSRNTIREALRALQRDGLIVRQRGRGTFVAPRAAATPPPQSITNLVLGYEATIRVIRIETVAATSQVSDFLGMQRGELLQKFVRVEAVDGMPLAVVLNYMPVGLGQRIRAADLTRYSMLEFLRDRLGIPLGVIRQSIEARMPDDEVASLLEIDLTQPVLFLRLYVSDTDGRPVEIADTYYRADRYRYEVEMPILPKRRLRKGAGDRRVARERADGPTRRVRG
jgi:GntR family transcriptional regulator